MNPVARTIVSVIHKGSGQRIDYVPRLPPGRVRAPVDPHRTDASWRRYVFIRGKDLAHQYRT